jgi:hypothetical protein
MMVAQRPFETADVNTFCKLIPLCWADGTLADSADFPNDGEVWWMLNARTASLADPGRLVVGPTESSVKYDSFEATSSSIQAQREHVREPASKEYMEIVNVPNHELTNLLDVMSEGIPYGERRTPMPWILIRWRGKIIGPFQKRSDDAHGDIRNGRLVLMPMSTDMYVIEVSLPDFNQAAAKYVLSISQEVTWQWSHRSKSELEPVRCEILRAIGWEKVLASKHDRVLLEPLDRKLLRFAKQCLTNRQRKELKVLLEEMELTGKDIDDSRELLDTVQRARHITEQQDAALNTVAEAMLKAGLLGEERVKKAEQDYAEGYVQSQIATLQAQVDKAVASKREELRRVELDLNDAKSRLQKEESQRRAALEQELNTVRSRAHQELAGEREDIGKQRKEIERQQGLLRENLEKVTLELRTAGDEVVNRFLTIAPLLGIQSTGQPSEASGAGVAATAVAGPVATFQLPKYLTRHSASNDIGELDESAFFARFCQFVQNSGFHYRLTDLERFHLSVKCAEITVLGGPSGIGKSSLPMLYARALNGEAANTDRPGCLMVNVNPSWMEIRDLLGHMNTLERRFYPAESGLFQHLIYAQKEFDSAASYSGVYFVCLDEMNLAQVEHYFSDFMMLLEREPGYRGIQCFPATTAGDMCPFRSWSQVEIAPSLRFIGTVNFDETTRVLSDRLLDRVNLIRLEPGHLPALPGGGALPPASTGRMVTLADFQAWRKDIALPTELGGLLDDLRPLLAKMRCPLSPRVYRAICRFVGSASPIMQPGRAFDAQLAQRIIPKIRSLITSAELAALDNFIDLLERSEVCPFEESLRLLLETQSAARSGSWDQEE